MNKEGGFYLKPRCDQDSPITHAPPYIREVYDWLNKEANHKDKKYGGFTVKRGQLFRTYNEIRDGLAWKVGYRKERYSENQMKKAMAFLRKELLVATTKELGGVLITVLNYNETQNPKNYESTNERTSERTNAEPMRNQPIPDNNKNEKNERIKEKIYKKENSDLHIRILKECSNLGIEFKSTPETFAVYENRYSEADIVRKAQDACVWLISKNLKELTIARLGKFLSDCKGKEQPKLHRTAADYEREFLLRTQTKNANTRNSLPQTA